MRKKQKSFHMTLLISLTETAYWDPQPCEIASRNLLGLELHELI